MAGFNPFEAGTAPAQTGAAAAAIRKDFEQEQQLVTGFARVAMAESRERVFFDDYIKDAQLRFVLSADKMQLSGIAKPPEEGGKPLTREVVAKGLENTGIVYGVDEAAIDRLLSPVYGEEILLAGGTAPVAGDGFEVQELFPRETALQKPEGDGPVDYGALGLFRDLKAGTVVLKVTPPKERAPGANVFGTPVPPPAPEEGLPIGLGLELHPNGRQVVMITSGNLVYRDGCFMVERSLNIRELPFGAGRIEFSGEIVAECDLPPGTEIIAEGNVMIQGNARGVKVTAKGDIILESALDGAGYTVIESKKRLVAGEVKDAVLKAGAELTASSLVGCEAECVGSLVVVDAPGLVSGGKVTCFGWMEIGQIGEATSELTTVTLGVTSMQQERRKRLKEQLDDVNLHITELNDNVAVVERMVSSGLQVPPERIQQLKRAQISLPISEKKRDQIQESLTELEKQLGGVGRFSVSASAVLPPVKIVIGGQSTNIIQKRGQTCLRLNEKGAITLEGV